MRVEPVLPKRHTIEETDNGLRIVIRSQKYPPSPRSYALLGLAALLIVGYLVFAVVIALTRGRGDSIFMHLYSLVIMPLILAFFLRAMLIHVLGITVIIDVQPAHLTMRLVLLLGKKTLRVAPTRAWVMDQIHSLRVIQTGRGAALIFDYGSSTVGAGPGVTESAAEEILAAICQRFPAIASTAGIPSSTPSNHGG